MVAKVKILTGICACPGIVKGKIKFYKENVVYTKEDIVVLNQWVTQDVFRLKNVGALLSSLGGLTCHASILAREFNVSCLVGIKGLDEMMELGKLKEGDEVEVDAAEEEVWIY